MEQPMVSINFATEVWGAITKKQSKLSPKLVFELYKEIPMSSTTELERAFILAKKVEEYLKNDGL